VVPEPRADAQPTDTTTPLPPGAAAPDARGRAGDQALTRWPHRLNPLYDQQFEPGPESRRIEPTSQAAMSNRPNHGKRRRRAATSKGPSPATELNLEDTAAHRSDQAGRPTCPGARSRSSRGIRRRKAIHEARAPSTQPVPRTSPYSQRPQPKMPRLHIAPPRHQLTTPHATDSPRSTRTPAHLLQTLWQPPGEPCHDYQRSLHHGEAPPAGVHGGGCPVDV
jgi:hypothetical protein